MTIREILEREGPILSSEIIKSWSLKENNVDTIRKKVERAIKNEGIGQIKGIWTKNQSFLYLNEQFKKNIFFEKLIQSLSTDSKSCYSIVSSLMLNGGIIKKELLKCYVGSPTELLKGHRQYSDYLDLLIRNGVVFDNGGLYYELNGLISPPNLSYSKTIDLVRNLTALHFEDWAKKIGLVAWGHTNIVNKEFGKFSWCFKAVSYISGIRKGETTPGFILADYLFGKTEYNEKDIDFFITKLESINKQLGIPKSILFLIIDTKLSDEAFRRLKSKGILITPISTLFGDEYSKIIKQIMDTISSAFTNVTSEEITLLISNIEKLVTGKTNNLRGELFEMLVALYHTTNSRDVRLSTIINYQGKQREIDVWTEKSKEIIFSECKAYKGKISKVEIHKWITENIPVIYGYYLNREQGNAKKVSFEYWATNGFDDEALIFLNEMKAKTNKYSINFFDRDAIYNKSDESGVSKLKSFIKEYFAV